MNMDMDSEAVRISNVDLIIKGAKMISQGTVQEQSKSGYFLIRSKLNGFVLDVAGNNPEPKTNLVVYPAKGTYGEPNQQWQITKDGLIKSKLNGLVLDIPASKRDPFTPLIMYPVNGANGTPNQQWTITEDGLIKSKLNDFVLDILGSIPEPLTPIVMYPVNGTHGTPNQQWELVPVPEETSPASVSFLTQGPKGSFINATNFDIRPKKETPKSRIKTVRIHAAWAIDKIQVQYENLATNPPETYESIAYGGSGGQLGEFSLEAGDYLTGILGTWGKQAPSYPQQDIVSLQFQTHKQVKSQVFGGGNSQKEVEPFSFEAPQGYEIIGFFGAYSGNLDVLVRLGVYLKAIAL
ncbi:jacalin-like lectin [Coleofasciculus sp. H7-2]|uniref:jacalin-like lectin n=1 Tax=Coleofasciculus sp. H7-2 TaxID=3351545 RepID=UPI00367338F6